jgi:hypothetical protein
LRVTSADAFSNPGHKQVASHRSKATNAENHKHRVATDASHRAKAAKAGNHKHQSPTEAKHSERAPGPRTLLASDPTNTGDLAQAPPDLAALKQAIQLLKEHKFSEAAALAASIDVGVQDRNVFPKPFRFSRPTGLKRPNGRYGSQFWIIP